MALKRKYLDKGIIILILILISSASVLSDYNSSLIIILAVFIALSSFRKIKLDKIIFIILFIWILINLTSAYFNPSPFSIDQFIGTSIRILISYLALKIVGTYSFWFQLERIIYKLTVISIPIFILNYLFPDIFNSLKPIFEPITSEVFYRKEAQNMYWYSFFYTNTGREEIRNSGFMWEPGAYAMMLILAIIYNWISASIIINKRIMIYIIAIITTFSTAGFLALSILIIAFTIYSKKVYLIGITVVALIHINLYMSSFDFLIPKVERYIEEFDNNIQYQQGYSDRLEVNRYLYFFITLDKASEFPIGHGVLEDKYSYNSHIKIVGVNGLGDVLMMWGWIGLTFVVISVYRFCKTPTNSKYITTLLAISILVTFFSNPVENNLILFLVVLTPFIKLKKYKI